MANVGMGLMTMVERKHYPELDRLLWDAETINKVRERA